MRFLFAILIPVLFSGCAPISEKEMAPPVIRMEAKPAACSFPKTYASSANVVAGAACLEMNLDNAFSSIVGKQDGELSVSELKTLKEHGLLQFEVTDGSQWNGIAGFLSLIHPQGRPAISKDGIRKFLVWVRGHASFFAKLSEIEKYKGSKAPFDPAFLEEAVSVGDELLDFFSDKGNLSLDQAQAILGFAQGNKFKIGSKAGLKLSALWRLKALLLESTRSDDNVSGKSLKSFLKVLFQIARHGKQSYQWWNTDFHPEKIPTNIEGEWQSILDSSKAYFANTHTFDMSTEEMQSLVQTLMPESEFTDQIPYLVKASQKLLAHNGDSHTGLIYGLLNLFEGANKVAADIRIAARSFSKCPDVATCSAYIGSLVDNQPLKSIVLISSRDWSRINYELPYHGPKRRNSLFFWKTAFSRIIEKGVVANIFRSFDSDNHGFIPYKSANPTDLKDATDIAYNIIAIASSENGKSKGKQTPLYLKPSTVVQAIGLLGDYWVMPGNGDGKIDVDEFYALLKLYEDINYIAQHSTSNLVTYATDPAAAQRPFPSEKDEMYVDRKSFIGNFGNVFRSEMPFLVPVFEELEKTNGSTAALIDLIVPKHKDSIDALPYGNPRLRIKLSDYLERHDLFAPAAFLVLFDRLIIKCDTDFEDDKFNWKELQCVAPRALDLAKLFFKSDMIELPPFLGDAGAFGADFLKKDGLPITLVKTAILNGSLSQFKIDKSFVTDAKERTKVSIGEMAQFLLPVSGGEERELKTKISTAFFWANGEVRSYWWSTDPDATTTVSGESAWDSLLNSLMVEGVIKTISTSSDGVVSADALTQIWKDFDEPNKVKFPRIAALKKLVELSFVLGVKPDGLDQPLRPSEGMGTQPMGPISPANILSLILDMVRPNGQ